ncbi:hypothetical protein COB52_04560 [Candidatus Kaiserbacteria bacterium]|nr:MAG: hypothetical protein COB52_04560 [Candidatus Kaiserbacteria bacterium]
MRATPDKIHLLASESSLSIFKNDVKTIVAPLAEVTYVGQVYMPTLSLSFVKIELTCMIGNSG